MRRGAEKEGRREKRVGGEKEREQRETTPISQTKGVVTVKEMEIERWRDGGALTLHPSVTSQSSTKSVHTFRTGRKCLSAALV